MVGGTVELPDGMGVEEASGTGTKVSSGDSLGTSVGSVVSSVVVSSPAGTVDSGADCVSVVLVSDVGSASALVVGAGSSSELVVSGWDASSVVVTAESDVDSATVVVVLVGFKLKS